MHRPVTVMWVIKTKVVAIDPSLVRLAMKLELPVCKTATLMLVTVEKVGVRSSA